MSIVPRIDLTIPQGATWVEPIQWMQERKAFKPITAVPQLVPARLTCVGHGMPDGWLFYVSGANGMEQLNNVTDIDNPYVHGIVDVDTVEVINLNASEFASYAGGGYVEYNLPYDLSLYNAASLIIRDSQGGTTVLDTLTLGAGITFDNTLKQIIPARTAAQSAAYTWTEGWYDLDVTLTSSGAPYRVCNGRIALQKK